MCDNVGIYKITSPSGKVYIGQSHNIKKRFCDYRSIDCFKQGRLYNSLKKYGVKAHEFDVVCELPDDVTQEVLDNYEGVYMAQYKDVGCVLLNIKEAGSNGKHSEETKNKIGEKNKGRYIGVPRGIRSDEHKRNISLAQVGKKKSRESVEKMRITNTGRKLTADHKANISKGNAGRVMTKETLNKIKETKLKRGIAMSAEVIEKGIPTRFVKGGAPWNKGKTGVYSEEFIANQKAKKVSEITRQKIRDARANQVMVEGRKASPEAKFKMSVAAKARSARITSNLPFIKNKLNG